MLTAKKKEHARFSGKRERFRSPVSQSAQHVTVTHPSPTGSAFLVDSLTSLNFLCSFLDGKPDAT